jgi:AcrR family transcriptional regulator
MARSKEASTGTEAISAAMDLLWHERLTPKRGPKPALTLDDIARAGIALADAEGLAALTMQSVAAALGYTKMALYRYIPGKDELVALMIDRGLGSPPPRVPGAEGWRPRLERWATELFVRFATHPWTLEVTTGIRPLGPNELAWLEQVVEALAGTGLPSAEKFDVAATLSGHVRAIAQQTVPGSDEPEQGLGAVMGMVIGAHPDRYPALSAALADMAENGGQNQAFEFGLARILDGLELHIAAPGGSQRD